MNPFKQGVLSGWPDVLLEFPVGHPHSEPGNERGWLEGETLGRGEEGREGAGYLLLSVTTYNELLYYKNSDFLDILHILL